MSQASWFSRYAKSFAASAVFAFGLWWILRRGALPVWPPRDVWGQVVWLEVAAAIALLVASMQLRFARYSLLIAPIAQVPLLRIMTISWIAVGLITFLPFRLGEFARPAMLREKGRLSGWTVTGTAGAERTIDAALFALLLVFGLSAAHPRDPLPDRIGDLAIHPEWVPRAAMLMACVSLGAVAAMTLFYFARTFAQRAIQSLVGLVSEELARRASRAVLAASEGLSFLVNLRYTVPFLAVSIFAILLHVWGIQLLSHAAGLHEIGFAEAMVLTGVLGIAFALPNAPGFFGSVQLSLYAGLALYVSPDSIVREGALVVFVFYLSYLGMVIGSTLLGLAVQAMERRSN